jgi:hypothetical protein
MTKLIKFASSITPFTYPTSSRNFLPKWFKTAEKFIGGKPSLAQKTLRGSQTIKGCTPFLDALTSGYMIELQQDIQVEIINNEPVLFWQTGPDPVHERHFITLQGMDLSKEHYQKHYAWNIILYVQTPKNYSILLCHPLNRNDLPFTTFSGVVDTDKVPMNEGNFPFLLKNNFEGIIPKGTPIAQVIPFKRDNWKMEIDQNIIEKSHKGLYRTVTSGWYKTNIWIKKLYS